MALPAIGHIACSVCGDASAQVKQTGKGHLMVYCEMCRTQQFCRDKKGDDQVRARMKAAPGTGNQEPPRAADPAPAAKKGGFASAIFGADDDDDNF